MLLRRHSADRDEGDREEERRDRRNKTESDLALDVAKNSGNRDLGKTKDKAQE